MSRIRAVYVGARPLFPPADQHPDASRYGPLTLGDGRTVFVDAIGAAPTANEIEAEMGSPATAKLEKHLVSAIAEFSNTPTPGDPVMKPEAAGLTVKQMMEEHVKTMGEIHQTQIALLSATLKRQVDTVTTAVGNVAKEIDSQTDDFLAAMGQFTNQI